MNEIRYNGKMRTIEGRNITNHVKEILPELLDDSFYFDMYVKEFFERSINDYISKNIDDAIDKILNVYIPQYVEKYIEFNIIDNTKFNNHIGEKSANMLGDYTKKEFEKMFPKNFKFKLKV